MPATTRPLPRPVLASALAVWALLVARITLGDAPADEGTSDAVRAAVAWLAARGVPITWLGLEAVSNVVMFVPLGALALPLLHGGPPRARRPLLAAALVVAAGALASAGIETTQATLLPTRVPTVQDVVLNTLGTAVGAAAASLVGRPRRRPATGGVPAPARTGAPAGARTRR
ncbi:VanZ family protein [Cellulomonas endophytica]|uniref:VanZ family protein n=1 Tax=Cellulomonas endophytica TaxID=2494735 RepID=UPI001F0B9B2A|nr:VanZ family protein [Cellulomonas endophytica]